MFFWNVPDANRYMVARSRTLTLRLADMHQPASDICKPLVDVILVGRFHDRLSVTTYESEYLDSFFHR